MTLSGHGIADRDGPVVAYLGWHGLGNLGDDAIYDAVRNRLPGATFVDLPRLPHQLLHATVTSALGVRTFRRGSQVVGGGTLVGRRQWRPLVKRGLALTRPNPSHAIGIGVEDPVFVGRGSGSGGGELKRWAPILAEFHTVSVRGPRSAELLSDIGIEVAVTGDPALLLPYPDGAPEDGLIGVNVGFGDDLWGHDPRKLAGQVSAAVQQLAGRGYRFVGVLMNPGDRRWTELALTDVAADVVQPADAAAAARELGRCSAAIVTRLHAGVLAALSATPVVTLEYQPKCRDFALSIDDERSLVRTDQVSAGSLVERLLDALANAPQIRTSTRAAVGRLRQRLDTEYAALGRQLGLAS
ncbi:MULTISPECIES: polysaccharide pyruvyl transferase family protein [unclassified Mycobacterium]|uniref:polysaccharide pyruvyl transferase family protein n=1 Tax=unclassified Mycobacterium TaxID=2642494 RepID=UPI000AAF315B|nr:MULTISPECIES: polysaccharide pyruvyl transferase family protein [unclassified Mycobacterium]